LENKVNDNKIIVGIKCNNMCKTSNSPLPQLHLLSHTSCGSCAQELLRAASRLELALLEEEISMPLSLFNKKAVFLGLELC
jgi:hypothetical protein